MLTLPRTQRALLLSGLAQVVSPELKRCDTDRDNRDLYTYQNSAKSRGVIGHNIMTDHPRAATHQPIPGSHQVFVNDVVASNPTVSHVPLLANGTTIDEEGSFTIKCICNYLEDDGFTVLCESCNTWQHAECYYEPENIPGEDDMHSCVDCEPRPLDARRANEIQRAKLAGIDPADRKNKRSVKSHKKKHELASPRNGIPKEIKKPKTTHKHSNSVHATSTPKLVSRRSASHTIQSPSKESNGAELTGEPYSEEFMHLYDDDPGESTMKANLFNDITVTSRLALWSDDVDELANATNGKKHPEVFLRTELLEAISRPQLQKHVKEDTARDFHGRHPKWIYLTTESSLAKESFVGELVGKIGLMTDYVRDPANRWEYLRHPLPFVFFHPILPIYIDTRNEGSLVRYLRRSCQPNLGLKTFLENGSDYKFGFVATKNIEAGMELTIPWTTDEHIRAYTQGSMETDENYILSYFTKVFADFGGCACESPDECAINKLARRLRALPGDFSTSNGKKRGRKPKDQALQRTNASRSGSEAVRYKEDDDDDDEQSTSTSSRSKPQSRDMTPQDLKPQGLLDEMSEREKRKLAAAVERIDQDKNQTLPKKKKRTSGPSNNSSSSTLAFPDRPQKDFTPSKPPQVDTGIMRKNSGSPTNKTIFSVPELPQKFSPTVRSPVRPPPNYVHSAMQTDPDPDDWIAPPTTELPKRRFLSLKKQLLMRAHQEKAMAGEKRKSEPPTPNGTTMCKHEEVELTASRKDVDGDIVMENITSASVSPLSGSNPGIEKPRSPGSPILEVSKVLQESTQPSHPPSIPSSASVSMPTVNGFRNADLRIPLLPVLMTNGISSNSTTTAQSPVVQSPSVFVSASPGSLVSPSPIKKKLSLGDYMRKVSTLSRPETLTLSKEKDADLEGSPTSVAAPLTIDEAAEKVAEHSLVSGTQAHQVLADAAASQPPDTMEVDTIS